MLHEPFGPRGAEDERDGFWTDLSEVTDESYRDPQQDCRTGKRTVGLGGARQEPAGRPASTQILPLAPETLTEEQTASRQDPLGSWTGVPDTDAYETPTQDADDL